MLKLTILPLAISLACMLLHLFLAGALFRLQKKVNTLELLLMRHERTQVGLCPITKPDCKEHLKPKNLAEERVIMLDCTICGWSKSISGKEAAKFRGVGRVKMSCEEAYDLAINPPPLSYCSFCGALTDHRTVNGMTLNE